jgi:hypothetical protein
LRRETETPRKMQASAHPLDALMAAQAAAARHVVS